MDCILDLVEESSQTEFSKSECFLNAFNGKDNLMLFKFKSLSSISVLSIKEDANIEYFTN